MAGQEEVTCMARIKFSTTVVRRGRFVCLDLPETASKKLGSEGRVPVGGTINGFPFETSVFPDGEGGHYLMLNQEMRKGASVEVGDNANIILKVDPRVGTLEIPEDLQRALAKNDKARSAFEDLSHSHKKEYLEWVAEAKRPETRARRIDRTVELLSESGLDG
jgi:hypothetical protein